MENKHALSSIPKISQVKTTKGTKAKPKGEKVLINVCKTTSSLTPQNNITIIAQRAQEITLMFLVICALGLPIQVVNIKNQKWQIKN